MKYFALAMVAVLAMASVSMAGVSIGVTQLADPNPGLESYRLSVESTVAGEQFWTWSDFVFAGVHVVGDYDSEEDLYEESTNYNLLSSGSGMRPFDTHYLFSNSTTVSASIGVSESNNDSNPTGIADPDNVYKIGIGTFTGGAASLKTPAVAGYQWFQIVIPKGSSVPFTGTVITAGSVGHQVSGIIGAAVPEPGTIVMLVAGALCLLGIRRK